MLDYLGWLGLTIAIEGSAIFVLAPRGTRTVWLLTGCAVNFMSHPPATWAVGSLGASWLAVELLVTGSEAVGFHMALGVAWARAARVALFANGISAAIGLAFAY